MMGRRRGERRGRCWASSGVEVRSRCGVHFVRYGPAATRAVEEDVEHGSVVQAGGVGGFNSECSSQAKVPGGPWKQGWPRMGGESDTGKGRKMMAPTEAPPLDVAKAWG